MDRSPFCSTTFLKHINDGDAQRRGRDLVEIKIRSFCLRTQKTLIQQMAEISVIVSPTGNLLEQVRTVYIK
jgi:hypothetical protein